VIYIPGEEELAASREGLLVANCNATSKALDRRGKAFE